MSFRAVLIGCMSLTLLSPLADAKPRHTKIPKSANYKHVTGAKHFKYKSPKKQKLNRHK